jgi:hypothetical protein
MKSANAIPVKPKDLEKYLELATNYLNLIDWVPAKESPAPNPSGKPVFRSTVMADARPAEKMSILEVAKSISKEGFLLSVDLNFLLHTMRTGLQFGMHIAEAYEKHSGLSELSTGNAQSRLSDSEKTAFRAKNQTKAAVAAFVFSLYVVGKLSSYKSDEVEKVKLTIDGPPEMPLQNAPNTLKGLLFYYGRAISKAETGFEAIKAARLYFGRVMDEIKRMSFDYAEPFTSVTYKLEGEEFIVSGFELQAGDAAPVVEFKRVEAKEIIGNHEMKRVLRRLSQFVIAYDFEEKMNPFVEYEAMNWLGVLQGWAGTGKSMGLSYMQTLVHDLCTALGLPFQVRPIPNAIVTSLQGDSARTYEDWWRHMSNPNFICVAPVDDSEAVYLDRRGQSSSEGSKLVVMSHLRLTEGSTAFYKGNVLQPHATNNADMIDPPVFSRYQYRVVVPGAQSREDFCDQMKGWGDRVNKRTSREIINLDFPGDYQYLSNQGLMSKEERALKADAFVRFKNEDLQRIWEDVERKKLAPSSYDLYGTFFSALHKRFQQFTSRDVRNVTLNTTSRLFGFDFDASWLENRDAFVAKDYNTKKQMILDAALQYQGGLTVDQVLFQEMVHYVESTIAMLDSGRQYRIRQQADDMLERKRAMALADSEWAEQQQSPNKAAAA